METNTAKPLAGQYAAVATPRQQRPKHDAVETELPPTKSVGQAGDMLRVNTSYREVVSKAPLLAAQEQAAGIERQTVSEYERDGESGDVVFKSINSRTGEVVYQVPSELQMKLRSYLQEMETGAGKGYRSASLDIRVDTRI